MSAQSNTSANSSQDGKGSISAEGPLTQTLRHDSMLVLLSRLGATFCKHDRHDSPA